MTVTLSLNTENRTPKPERLQLLAHHDVYDQPESGCTVQLGGVSVHLSGEDTIKLGTFLAGGHAALGADAYRATSE